VQRGLLHDILYPLTLILPLFHWLCQLLLQFQNLLLAIGLLAPLSLVVSLIVFNVLVNCNAFNVLLHALGRSPVRPGHPLHEPLLCEGRACIGLIYLGRCILEDVVAYRAARSLRESATGVGYFFYLFKISACPGEALRCLIFNLSPPSMGCQALLVPRFIIKLARVPLRESAHAQTIRLRFLLPKSTNPLDDLLLQG